MYDSLPISTDHGIFPSRGIGFSWATPLFEKYPKV